MLLKQQSDWCAHGGRPRARKESESRDLEGLRAAAAQAVQESERSSAACCRQGPRRGAARDDAEGGLEAEKARKGSRGSSCVLVSFSVFFR